MRRILHKLYRICVPIAVYIAVWQLLSMLVGNSLLLPSPWETLVSVRDVLSTGRGWRVIGLTLLRIVSGYLLGCTLGVLLAVLTSHSRVADWLLKPLRSLVKTTPITSFALILLVSVVSGVVPVVVATIVVVPMIWQTTEEALRNRSVPLDEMSRIFLTPWKKLRYVTLPQILPPFFATASVSLGFAWKAVITAEILSLPRFGIGREMQSIKTYMDTSELFAWTLLVICMSVLMESAFKALVRKAGKRYD